MRETSGNNGSYKQVRKNTSLNHVIYIQPNIGYLFIKESINMMQAIDVM